MHPRTLLALPLLLALPSLGGCSIVSVDSKGSPPRIESSGLIESHLALGIPEEDHLLHFDLFDGTSDGAIGELVIWKLFRFELGLAGVSMSLGPLHLGLGVLAYEPEVPAMLHRGDGDYEDPEPAQADDVQPEGMEPEGPEGPETP